MAKEKVAQEENNEVKDGEQHTESTQEEVHPNAEAGGEEASASKEESTDWKDKYVRLHAEFDNFRKRTSRERMELIKNANGELITSLISVLDDFDRAMKHNEQNDDPEALKEGFQLIHNKLYKVLEGKGLEPMNAQGESFDTEFHEALTQIPAPSDDLKGKVVDVIEKGYFLNGNILRYAKVVVGN